MNERSSLLQQPSSADPKYAKTTTDDEARNSRRFFVWRRQDCLDFLEGQTPAGKIYERFMIVLIGANVLALIVGSLFVEQYTKNPGKVNDLTTAAWSRVWDALLFGNHADNGLQSLHLGATSLLELVSVLIFTLDYMGRIGTADLIVVPFSSTDQVKYLFGPPGWRGRFRWMFSFYSIVDLATILPFYCDVLLLRHSDMTASLFLRMFRLLRMMRSQGSSSTTPIYSNDPLATQQHPQATIKHYDSAWSMIDDILAAQKSVLITTGFVGVTVWIAVSSLYYLAERRNLAMVYCPVCYNEDEDNTDDTINFTRVTNNNNQRELDPFSDCTIDSWGNVDCGEHCNGCYHLYESIPMASYYALLNLFGEFPHIETHSTYGKAVAVFTSVVAVAVFALPVGIVGNGVKDVVLAQRKKKSNSNYSSSSSATALQEDANEIQEEGGMTFGFYAVDNMLRGQIYNVLHSQTARGALAFDAFINILIVSTAISFMLDTVDGLPDISHIFFDSFELISVTIFTVEYIFRVYSAKEDPKYSGSAGRIKYMITFLSLIDLLSFLPYWIEFVALRGNVISSTSSTGSDIVKSLRLLRIFRFERYTHAFLTFDDVFTRNRDILEVTAFTAILFWVFFSACLYLTERDSLDAEIASNYSTVPNSMWITLLNLSGESPLSQYSAWGKIITAVLGLVATGIFGIPIGVLGAGFEEIVSRENQDNTQELEDSLEHSRVPYTAMGTTVEQASYKFVHGIGSLWATRFELSVYALILLSVAVGAWQTVDGHERSFQEIEWIAVVVFTFEYVLRFIGVGANPDFSTYRGNGIRSRLRFMVSFYSVIDLLAIIPFYVTVILPNSVVNDYDEYLRMLRILRLVKLDKYVPSISLIDDVFRLKLKTLSVAFYASVTLWVLFAAALYLCEHHDNSSDIDPVPLYGCIDDCTMSYRFRNFFDSMVYTGVHLTGDYPIVTYNWPARIVNFFMVIAAVGVVSIPSGLIASGFVEIVQCKHKCQSNEANYPVGMAGDDWYEISYRELEGVEPPPSPFGTKIDKWQQNVNEFLNGKTASEGHHHWSRAAFVSRIFIFTLILANILAVLLESVPKIDQYVGNKPGNFFDQFEFYSVIIFALEYFLRLFCAPKSREALYSTYVYATTFFGIVDFLSIAPWIIERSLIATGSIDAGGDNARIFRIFRIFRILQLEDFIVAFSKLDNVFRASKDVLKATGLMAIIVWVSCGALFFIFEENNPNWRSCDSSIPVHSNDTSTAPGCYDFVSTAACNQFYPGMCTQKAFVNMPDALYYTAVFLAGEWGVVDFTWSGRCICLFLCVVGIGLYSIPIGTLFDSFGNVLGLGGDDDDEEEKKLSTDGD